MGERLTLFRILLPLLVLSSCALLYGQGVQVFPPAIQVGVPAERPFREVFSFAVATTEDFTAVSDGTEWMSADARPAEQRIDVTLSGTGLRAGPHVGHILVVSNTTRRSTTITVTIAAQTRPRVTAIVDAATGVKGPVAPGQIVTIYGSMLGIATGVCAAPAKADGVAQVTINGHRTTVLCAGFSQVSVLIDDAEPVVSGAWFQLTDHGIQSEYYVTQMAPLAPALFTSQEPGFALATNEDAKQNTAATPAIRGRSVRLYINGAGKTQPTAVQVGDIATTEYTAKRILINGAAVIEVTLPLPTSLPAYPVPVRVDFGSISTQTLLIAVRD